MSNNTNPGDTKKITLLTGSLLAIGTIIGSGILGTLPAAVSITGKLTFICIIVATVNVFFSNFVNMIVSGAIPVNAGPYVYLTRLVHPVLAVTDMVQVVCSAFLLALMGTIFGGYFQVLVPSVNATVVSILVIAVFGVLNLFGIDVAVKVGNVLVILLVVSFIIYSFYGFTVDTSSISGYVPETSKPLTFVGVGTVSALFVSTLSGGSMVSYIAESFKNPKKDIVRAFTISIIAVTVLYSIMSFATARAAGQTSFDSLAVLAKTIMPKGLFLVFLLGGAFTAILTTINGMIIQNVAILNMFATDKILPGAFDKKNKAGVNYLNVVIMTGVPIFILAFGLDIFTLLAVSSVLVVFTTLIKLIPCLTVEKKYPIAYKKAYVHPSFKIMVLFVVIAAALNIYSGVSTIISTAGKIWIILAIMTVAFLVYLLIRNSFLKNKGGEDLWTSLRKIPESWIEANKE